MIKITLLGDSIRTQGYGPKVPELLGKDFEVYQPSGNCRFAKHTLRGMYDWKKEMEGSRIVHWNNGLWDICDLFGDGAFSSEAEYLENMLRIADILTARYEKVIFATTTPVARQNQYNTNELICRYNELIVPPLMEHGIVINDLHKTVAADIDRYICSDTIHLSDEGTELCSVQVADAIRKCAAELSQAGTYSDVGIPDFIGAPV